MRSALRCGRLTFETVTRSGTHPAGTGCFASKVEEDYKMIASDLLPYNQHYETTVST